MESLSSLEDDVEDEGGHDGGRGAQTRGDHRVDSTGRGDEGGGALTVGGEGRERSEPSAEETLFHSLPHVNPPVDSLTHHLLYDNSIVAK